METLLFGYALYALQVLILVSIVFLIAQLRHDNSVMDIAYGPIYAIAAWGSILLTGTTTFLPLLIATLITLWALRLGIRIGRKNWGAPEDARYAKWRTEWMQHGTLYFILRSFIQINLLQGFIITIVALPFIISVSADTFSLPFLILGALIMFGGLAIETRADSALDRFIGKKRRGETDAEILTTGLFGYSRHPNYVGETLVWWGLAVTVAPLSFGFLAFLSPVVLTYIITQVTGPILEAHMEERYPDAFKAYREKVPYFLPWFTK